MRKLHFKNYIFGVFLLLLVNTLKAQSPYRIFTLDANLKTESEQNTASLVLKAMVLNKMEFLHQNESRFKPTHKADLKALKMALDTLQSLLPANGEYSWEEDYGLRLDGVPKHERYKELTFYKTDFDMAKGPAEILNGKRKPILQVRIWIDMNSQIENIELIRGKKMINRDAQLMRSYNILYKPKKKK